jgi:hypothetical protein
LKAPSWRNEHLQSGGAFTHGFNLSPNQTADIRHDLRRTGDRVSSVFCGERFAIRRAVLARSPPCCERKIRGWSHRFPRGGRRRPASTRARTVCGFWRVWTSGTFCQ